MDNTISQECHDAALSLLEEDYEDADGNDTVAHEHNSALLSEQYRISARQLAEQGIQKALAKIKADQHAEEEQSRSSRKRCNSPTSLALAHDPSLKDVDWHQHVTWNPTFNDDLESHWRSVKKHSCRALGFHWDHWEASEASSCWGREHRGTWRAALDFVCEQIYRIKRHGNDFYIGISIVPFKRYCGKDMFPDYDIIGHCVDWDHMRVVAYGDAALIRVLEIAAIMLYPTSANKGKGGERCGPPGTLSFLYVVWRDIIE